MYLDYLNTSEDFRNAYSLIPGRLRRQKILALFKRYPDAILPVNSKHVPISKDLDLARLLKKGVLKQIRDGGGLCKVMRKNSAKRQTYLVLVKGNCES